MIKILNSHNIYKLIVCIFLLCAILKIKTQLVTLNSYNSEISALNEKIALLESQINENDSQLINSKKDNENMARKNLKMYYPNETPYKGY